MMQTSFCIAMTTIYWSLNFSDRFLKCFFCEFGVHFRIFSTILDLVCYCHQNKRNKFLAELPPMSTKRVSKKGIVKNGPFYSGVYGLFYNVLLIMPCFTKLMLENKTFFIAFFKIPFSCCFLIMCHYLFEYFLHFYVLFIMPILCCLFVNVFL